MKFDISNKKIEKVENNLILILNLLEKTMSEHPNHYDDLKPIFDLAKIHANNIIFIKNVLNESINEDDHVDVKKFKDFILDANEFCKEGTKLINKHFP